MTFNLIQRRTSVRTFEDKPIKAEDLKWINDIVNSVNNEKGPNGNSVRFLILNSVLGSDGNIAGTYGFIRNARTYIAGSAPSDNPNIEDYGYLLEKIIVRLVEKNIGSCWLGGTFRRSDFEDQLALKEGFLIPAVMPIGYPVQNRRTAERAMRFMIKADKRRKWSDLFFLDTFQRPLAMGDLKDSHPLLFSSFESVRLGPSASNKQPWRLVFTPSSDRVHFYLNEDPGYNGNKLGFSMQRLDAGIAMYHFESAAAENEILGNRIDSDPDLELPDKNYKYIKTFSW